MCNGKIHYKWPFSIARLVYRRVNPHSEHPKSRPGGYWSSAPPNQNRSNPNGHPPTASCIGCVALKFPWSSFFDDFITLCRKNEAPTMEIATSQFFRLLGWLVSEGDKNLPFAVPSKRWALRLTAPGAIWMGPFPQYSEKD